MGGTIMKFQELFEKYNQINPRIVAEIFGAGMDHANDLWKQTEKYSDEGIKESDENILLLKEQIDPITKEILKCWDTINTDNEPDVKGAEKCLYALHSQGINSDIIVNFIDIIEGGKLQLLVKNQNNNYSINNENYINDVVLPKVQTDLFIEEVANLKIKHMQGGKLSVEQVTKSVDRDRYSAVAYGLWYIKNFEDKVKKVATNISPSSYFAIANKSARARR